MSDSVPDVTIFRLYLLRVMYAFIATGLALTRWPELIQRPSETSHMDTVVASMLGAVSLLAMLGIRYPLRMLPLLLFELLWKSIWVLTWALPRWIDYQLDADTQETLVACLLGIVLVPIVVPWGYTFHTYLNTPGDPWRRHRIPIAPAQAPSPAQPATTPRV